MGRGQGNWFIADFDGDQVSDLAVKHSEASSIRVDIRLSTEPRETSILHRGGERGLRLLIYDVDRDNDPDLIFASLTSFAPPAIWLNDGKGHFELSGEFNVFSLTHGGPSGLETEGSEAEAVLAATDDGPPNLDRSGGLQARLVALAAGLLTFGWEGFVIDLATIQLSPRSPPRFPACSSISTEWPIVFSLGQPASSIRRPASNLHGIG